MLCSGNPGVLYNTFISIAPYYITPCYKTPCYIAPCYIIPCYITPVYYTTHPGGCVTPPPNTCSITRGY